ncbi:HAMP domain-containing protein [Pelagibius litoralis]|uniref:histidine kinase n=1 Tax=Pelagibius litoralis TaxID=374515 RepID=A0A967EZ14_9PROT|nr:ATP-binding protein [Pelagibius litoralis]NIA70022.1 HAMP domain-containing protein [Pelagibius litoralis]
MRLLPRSLAGQLIALLLTALVLSQAATVFIFADERRFALREASRDQVLARTATLVRLIEQTPTGLHENILAAARSRRLEFSLSPESAVGQPSSEALEQKLALRLGELIGDTRETRVRLLTREPWSLRDWHSHPRRSDDDDDDDDDDDKKRRPHKKPRAPISFLASVPLADGNWLNASTALPTPSRAWAWFPLLSMGLMALAILAIVIFSVRRITRPLRALSGAAERLGRGESQIPLAETGPEEIRRTTRAFNAMQERLTRFVQDRTRMLAAIGHDLRTPITALRLRAEFVEDAETRRKILETLEEMSRMTEAVMSFAREEAKAEPTRRVDLTALVESLVDDLADQGRDVAFAADEAAAKIGYNCRPVSLKRVLHNLIENALRYAGQARVSLRREDDGLYITVEDDGPGIPEDQLEQVFEPFVRLEESRSQDTGGVGLGLAIARSIAHAHGGDLHLENRPEGGLRAILTLPLDPR